MTTLRPAGLRTARSLPLGITALALLLSSTVPALAGPGRGDPLGRLTPEQQQKIFPEFRTLMLEDHQARITILQKGERCLRAARDSGALRSCLREERSSYISQRSRHRDQMRQMFQRNGIAVPDWGRRSGKGNPGRGTGSV